MAVAQWGMDYTCGGITWMFPDVDPRKNSITILEAIQSSAQIAKALQATEPIRASTHRQRAQDLWRFFTDVGLLGDDFLVHDNVTGTADGSFHCCNSTRAHRIIDSLFFLVSSPISHPPFLTASTRINREL